MRFVPLIGAIVLAIWIVHPPKEPPRSAFQAHFLDVGQGDAILLQYPDGTADLVDGGGFWNEEALDTGTSVLLPYLCSLGIRELHRVFLTHAHADHMNGLISLMKYVPVRELYVSRKPVGDRGYQRFVRSIPLDPRSAYRGMIFRQGEVVLRVLAPDDSGYTRSVANDDSLVILVDYAGKRLLLPGDAEKPTEDKLLSYNDLQVDYLKAAHHGSRTSSSEAILNKLKMKVVFISSGRNNWFGHPAPEVLERFRNRRAFALRTDHLGTIILTCEHSECSVDSWKWAH